jgi:beta-lactamase superfamily II metal-dependent hydrolase
MPYVAIRYVSAWPSCILRETASASGKGLTQCLWGDWVGVYEERADGWAKVRTRGRDGWLKRNQLTDERPLEVNFVDIGQGDGTFIVTPDDHMIVVDAGESENMHRFLKWRFNLRSRQQAPHIGTAIITHPDSDHYKGFQKLFDDSRFLFGTVFHSGIVERAGADSLGPSQVVNGQKYLTDIVTTRQALQTLLSNSSARGGKLYPKLLWTALNSGRVADMRAAAAGDVILDKPLFNKSLRLEVLAPVRETVQGKPALRWFADNPGPTTGGNAGMTKNGHSVVTMLSYGKVKILLGGDLNIPAEDYLMAHYAGAPATFRSDFAKACHHGSADFSTAFLDLTQPLATVISSGDDESHCHPRADALGAVGKHSRGARPLIFSTELARSAPERITQAREVRAAVMKLADAVVRARTDETRKKARDKLSAKLDDVIQRTVQVYGLITLRTDGNAAIVAQRLEQERSATSKWDIYPMERQADGSLAFAAKH